MNQRGHPPLNLPGQAKDQANFYRERLGQRDAVLFTPVGQVKRRRGKMIIFSMLCSLWMTPRVNNKISGFLLLYYV